jgi:hypothetical protein
MSDENPMGQVIQIDEARIRSGPPAGSRLGPTRTACAAAALRKH